MSKLLDTWAWMEFYEGSQLGEEVYRFLEDDKQVSTSIISLAELSDNYHRGNMVSDHSWKEIRGFIRTNTRMTGLEPGIISAAGKIKAEERKQKPDFGLMDAIILATARQKDLELVSGDPHLASKNIAIDLRK